MAEYNGGKLGMYDPASKRWREYETPSARSQPYAVIVDRWDAIWVSEFNPHRLSRFVPYPDDKPRRGGDYTEVMAGARVAAMTGRRGSVVLRPGVGGQPWR